MVESTTSDVRVLEARAGEGLSGERLDRAAASLFPGFSRARLQQWIRDGALTVDGQPGKPSQKLAGGEHLRLEAQAGPDDSVQPQEMPLKILFEDGDILVLDKPAGLVVHPAAGHRDGTLQNALLHHDTGLARVPRAGIVHRLDKDTTGVMVVARNLEAHASLVEQLQARSMSRVYEAVVHGRPAATGRVEEKIGRHPRDRKRMAVVDSGKPAVSHYRVLRAFGHFSLVEVALESGRTHQIRVHMQHLGLPLVGDPVYGRRRSGEAGLPVEVARLVKAFPRQALHARTLRLAHPRTGQPMSFEAPLPDDLAGLIRLLEREDPA